MKQRALKNANGFTLIELLVVIAIISILATILLPSLRKANELAKDVVCKSNLRGIAQATHLYCNDYNGEFPNDGVERFTGNVWFVVCEEYFAVRDILHCPSCDNSLTSLSWMPGEKYKLDLGMNYRLLDRAYSAAHSITELVSPMETLLLGDCASTAANRADYWILSTNNLGSGWNVLDPRHSEKTRSNVAYTDGHAGEPPIDLLDLSVSYQNWVFWYGTQKP